MATDHPPAQSDDRGRHVRDLRHEVRCSRQQNSTANFSSIIEFMFVPLELPLSLAAMLVSSVAQAQQPLARDTIQPRAAPSAVYSAISHADTATLRRLLGDDLRWVAASSGAVIDKAQLLTVAGHPFPQVTLEYDIDSLRTWRHGDIATAEYRLTTRRVFREDSLVFKSRGTDVFTLRSGGWELIRHTDTWIVGSPATIAMDSAALVPFVGRYQLGAGYVDDVHFLDGHLVAQSTAEALVGATGARLFPVSTDTFSPDSIAPMIVFERDPRGRVTGYVQQQPDGTIKRAKRLNR